jgi:shikimate dehydrogenase
MPLKERAFELAVHTDEVATLTRTVNTLFREDATQPWRGWNTDVGGLAKVLEDFTCDAQHTIVLGTGATAISALLAAKARGARTATIVGRRAEAVEALVQRFAGIGRDHPLEVRGCLFTDHDAMTAHVQAASLIVSSLPGSACENLTLPADTERLPLVDVAYDPWPSPLAKRWHENGGSAYSGVEMLVNQALLQVRVFVSGDVKNALPEEARVFAAMREAANSQV